MRNQYPDDIIPRNKKSPTIDRRLKEGRLAGDDLAFSDTDLEIFMNNMDLRNIDGTIDMRTREGRALRAAEWIDDEGFPINEDPLGLVPTSANRYH